MEHHDKKKTVFNKCQSNYYYWYHSMISLESFVISYPGLCTHCSPMVMETSYIALDFLSTSIAGLFTFETFCQQRIESEADGSRK